MNVVKSSLRNPAVTITLVAMVFLAGLVSLLKMPLRLFKILPTSREKRAEQVARANAATGGRSVTFSASETQW